MNEAPGYTDMNYDYMNSASGYTPSTDMDSAAGYMDPAGADYANYMAGTSSDNMYNEYMNGSMSPSSDMSTDASDYDDTVRYETALYDEQHNLSPVRIEESAGGFMSMIVEMSDSFFRDTVQFELGKTENTVDAQFRLAFNMGYGEPVTYTTTDGSGAEVVHEMVDEFVVRIIGNDDYENSCEDVTAVLDESARAEYKFGFNSTTTY
jgi:hypothetical protein